MANLLERQGPISSGALNLTLGSGVAAAVLTLLEVFSPAFVERVLGPNPSAGARGSLFIAVVAAWAIVAVSDIAGRAYAHAHDHPLIAAAPEAFEVSRPSLPKADEEGWSVLAIRMEPDSPNVASYLVAKKGNAPEWVGGDQIEIRR